MTVVPDGLVEHAPVLDVLTAAPLPRVNLLPPEIAEHRRFRRIQVGLGAGWVTGAATGVGLGAFLAWLVAKVLGRRP